MYVLYLLSPNLLQTSPQIPPGDRGQDLHAGAAGAHAAPRALEARLRVLLLAHHARRGTQDVLGAPHEPVRLVALEVYDVELRAQEDGPLGRGRLEQRGVYAREGEGEGVIGC